MNIVNFILMLLIGIGIFLLGMNIMGDGLERAASGSMRKLLGKVSNNRFVGVGVGTAITAIIHSSSAMTVMVISFVNAGLMSLYQATNLIMGANIGTTVTGLLVALDALDMGLYMMIPVFIGVVIMLASRKEKIKRVGSILAGMGLIFVGLSSMSDAVAGISGEAWFQGMFESVNNPILLMLIGIVVTAVIQSSTAVNAIILVLVGSVNGLTVVQALYIILGTNVGTCGTALLAGIGGSVNAKRASVVHLLFNLIGTAIFILFFLLVDQNWLGRFMQNVFGDVPAFQIAWFNFFQNVITTLMLLPFARLLVRLANFLVKDKHIKQDYGLKYIDDRLLVTPSIAVSQAIKEVEDMAATAKANYKLAINALTTLDLSKKEEFKLSEEKIDSYNIGIVNYLIKLTGESMTYSDKKLTSSLYHVVADIERIGDHSDNIMEFAEEMAAKGMVFTAEAQSELKTLTDKIDRMFDLGYAAFFTSDPLRKEEVNKLESEVDKDVRALNVNHIKRLNEGVCHPESGLIFYGTITNLERIADHLNNISEVMVTRRKSSKAAPKTAVKSGR